eukprot:gene26971-32586_t
MGGTASTVSKVAVDLQKSEKEVVKLMMPVYYIPDTITPEERALAARTWNLILDDKAPQYLHNKATNPDFHYNSSVTFFYDSFYIRLFDIHPMSRQLFKGGKFLVKMISLALSELDDAEKFDRNLVKLAEIHYQRGVKAVEYGIVGEILFWVMRHVLGTSTYLQAVHFAWVKVYSRMLTTIVPVAIGLELKGGSVMAKERTSYRSSAMFDKTTMKAVEESTQRGSHGAPMSKTNADEDDDEDNQLISEKIRVAENTESAKSIAKSHSKLFK